MERKNFKAGFTMIELIFVIVILAILAAVALPKFVSVGEQAHDQNVKSFVGTMNGSVIPTIWSISLKDGKNGNVSSYLTSLDDLKKYTDIPKEISNDGNVTDIDNRIFIYGTLPAAPRDVNNYDCYTYVMSCDEGDATHSPKCNTYLSILKKSEIDNGKNPDKYHKEDY